MMPRSLETMEFVPLDDGGTLIHWRIKLEDRGDEAVRHFEAVAAFLEANAPELWGEALRKVLEEDGVARGPSDATARER